MSFEALRGTRKAFQGWAIETRNHAGQVNIAKIMREILNDSKICLESESRKVQDAYSLRCIPQVYGAVEDTIRYVKSVLEIELNSATDNPLVNDTEFISAGNFHGEPVAFASDFLGIALCDLGNIIERRIARITDEKLSDLPPFLVKDSGLNSGYMIAQYTAAALCNRNKTLAVPSSIDTIPTCANQEDHVSMGTNSAIKLTELVKNLRQIIAIEYVLAAQALDLLEEEPCSFNELLRSEIRESIDHLHEDRPVFRDIEKMVEIIESSREFDKIISDIHVNV
jgi:histidine ammonia-lyase